MLSDYSNFVIVQAEFDRLEIVYNVDLEPIEYVVGVAEL